MRGAHGYVLEPSTNKVHVECHWTPTITFCGARVKRDWPGGAAAETGKFATCERCKIVCKRSA